MTDFYLSNFLLHFSCLIYLPTGFIGSVLLYFNGDFFSITRTILCSFQKLQQAQLFRKECDNVYDYFLVSVNGKKQPVGCNVNFLALGFDNLLIEAQLPKDKLRKTMERVVKILENKRWTINEELKSLVGLFFLAAKVVCLGQVFLGRRYDALVKSGRYLHWSKFIRNDLLW